MKFTIALSFLAASAVQAMDHSNFKLQKEFMAAMHSKSTIKAAAKVGKMQQLNERLLKASRQLQNNQGGSYNTFLADQDGNIYYQGNDGLYYTSNGAQVQPNANGLYPWEYNAIPYDLASRSFKYAGCSAIKSYDTDRAEENGNPMVLDNFAVFRLCPADHCNQYSTTGCSKNYGEYAVDIKTYLMYLLSFYDEEYEGFCEYCKPCDYQVQSIAKMDLQVCHQTESENQYQLYSQLRQQAYNDYVTANGQKSGNSFNWFGFGNKNSGSSSQSASSGNPYSYTYNATADGEQDQQNADAQQEADGEFVAQFEGQLYSWQSEANQDYTWNHYETQEAREEAYANNAAYQSCMTFVEGMQFQYLTASQANGGNADYSSSNSGQTYYDEDGNFQGYGNQDLDTSMYQYWMGMGCCEDGSVCDTCQVQVSEVYGFCDDYVCGSDYYSYCSDYYKSQQEQEIVLTDFLECSPYVDGNGKEYYIGPHCGSDHFTISLGVFSDENCVNYIGDSVSLKTILGSSYSDKDLFQFPEACISCDGMDDYAEYLEQGTSGRYGAYSALPDKATDTAFAMCSTLYTLSAQCNEHMNNYYQVSRLMSSVELADEARSCTFISNIMGGSFDESGIIQLKDDTFIWNDLRNPHQYRRLRMPVMQALSLSASMILAIAMAALAFSYQRAFRREGKESPWSPTAIFQRRHGLKKPAAPKQAASDGSTPIADPDGNYVMLA